MDAIHGLPLLRFAAEHASDPVWIGFWRVVAFVGAPDFFAVALPVVAVLAPARFALRIVLAFATSATLAETVKHLVDRPRLDPALFGVSGVLEDPGAYANSAFPSGHVLMAVVLWGLVAGHSRSRAVRVVCALVVALVAASRIALLRHDLLDVGGGFVFGTALLVALFAAERAWADSLAALPRIERAGLWTVGAAALQITIGLPVTAVLLGVGAGLGAGMTLAAGRRSRTTPVAPVKAVVRVVLALVGVAGARALAEPGDGWTPAALFGLYFAAASWVGAVVPLLTGGVIERPRTAETITRSD